MENTIMDRVKNSMKDIRILSEELRLQMALGKAEARDLFEKERKSFSKYINDQRQRFADAEKYEAEHRREFLNVVEDLESKLTDDVPTKVRAYDKYKKELLENIYRLEEMIRGNYAELNPKMQDMFDAFKGKMDAFRINLALHDKDDPEMVQNVKSELTDMVEDIRLLLSKEESDQSKVDNFVEDMNESFNYLKRAVENLSK